MVAQRGRSSAAGKGRAYGRGTSRRSPRDLEEERRDRRQVLQVLVCGGAFLLLVAAKLLSPDGLAAVQEPLLRALGENMDVEAVFSSLGKSLAGEEGSPGQEFYKAVFGPSSQGDPESEESAEKAAFQSSAEAAAVTLPRKEGGRTALKTLQAFRPERETASDETPELAESAQTVALYSGKPLPDKVCMEQVLLNFSYSTPVLGVLSSGFGFREHPVEGGERFHYGVDLAADEGTDVRCFADGTVSATGESSSYGKYCVVSHAEGFSTLYAHCSRVTAASGAAVKEREKLAEVGQTGMATGPHLHFELLRDGEYLNPIYYVEHL